MSKHTPGPWHYAECQMGAPFVDTESVGDLFAAALPLDEERANVRLIAAAPDLLAVCADLVEMNDAGVPCPPRLVVLARMAVAKARGE